MNIYEHTCTHACASSHSCIHTLYALKHQKTQCQRPRLNLNKRNLLIWKMIQWDQNQGKKRDSVSSASQGKHPLYRRKKNPALSQGKHLDDSADKNMGTFVAVSTHCFVKWQLRAFASSWMFGSLSSNSGMSALVDTSILQIQIWWSLTSSVRGSLETPRAKPYCAPADQGWCMAIRSGEGQQPGNHLTSATGTQLQGRKPPTQKISSVIYLETLMSLSSKFFQTNRHTPKIVITSIFLLFSRKRHQG